MNGGRLPPHVLPFCGVAALLAACLPLTEALLHHLKARRSFHYSPELIDSSSSSIQGWLARACSYSRFSSCLGWVELLLPSGIGFAVGMYVSPKWTIPRVLGSVAEQLWFRLRPGSHASLMVVCASGLVLGEGTASIVSAIATAIMQ